MKNFFSATRTGRRLARLSLALGLLAGPTAALAQTAPSLIYGLGTATQAFGGFAAGQQVLVPLYPANLSNTTPLYGTAQVITGVTAGQQLVGIDARPSTGQLYGLGYNAGTGATQLYLLSMPTSSTTSVTATPINATPITLNLQDPNSSLTDNTANTRGLITNVGFDFNPRADRIRVVAPNGVNYRLNPNTGGLVATDTNLSYVAGNTVGHAPYIGTAAYTNSATAVAGTTLYDIDVTNTNALLSIQGQNTPNDGILNPVAPVTFQTNTNPNFFPLTSPTIGLDVDVYYDRSSSSNLSYLVEARYSDKDNKDINNGGTGNQFSSNLWALDLQTGKAVGRNIFGQVPIFISNIAAMNALTLVWTGAVSSDWQTPGNWFPNQVPTTADDVFIAGTGTLVGPGLIVANQPIITATTSVARSLTLDNSAVLTSANGSLLSLAGNFINNGGSVTGSGTGTLALAGSAQQDIGGTTATSFWNLQIGANGAATSTAESIRRSVAVNGGTLAIGSGLSFTLLSDASGTAYVVNNGGGTVTGTATVQRYITPTNPGLGYRHYSSPVSGNTVADFATSGYSPVVNPAYNSASNPRQTSPYPTVFYYDQSRLATSNAAYAVGDFDNGFLSPSALSDALVTARGYTVNISSGALVDFQGTLNQNASYARTGLARGAQTTAGYQLLGNPYPSALNYDALITNTTGMESALYVYKSSGQYTGTYTTYVPAGPTNGGPGVSANGGTSNIPVAQGFFMRTAAGQTGSVTFSTAARTTAPETALFQRTANTLSTLALTLSGNGVANQTRVYFDQQATPAFDAKYDAHYLPATHGLDLASDISTEALAINGLPELTGATTVALRVHAPTAGTYTLTVDELLNLPAGYRAYLRDASTGTYTDLTTTPSVSLTLAPGEAPTGRFALLFTAASPLATAPAALAALAAVYPSPAHGTATLVLPQALRGNSASTVQLLNALGQVVLTKTVAAGSGLTVELPLAGIAAGIYTVRATTEAGIVAKRLVVQ
ncbi:DUF4394 domain-containing protein [Hymenobacter cheonanensis]|uniref:DUF4394 domain-containing protein n=1 Tax=Hymenobacter sp. CA2-7 TaxID=3063993 RepID=UPI0027131110|nr:DUF4394 domain-containing protein [Hymenobacter sp. CA2-7]MDO7886212.1 DUF4394 domain-containing protein [Hymenobacter sp. CA2-7]